MEFTITIKVENDQVEVVKIDKVKKEENPISKNLSVYARFFDAGCAAWENDSEFNLTFLKIQQNYANEKLKSQGYLFLNDVYDMLGIPRTKAGQVVGWVYNEDNPIGDNFVDFGIYSEGNRDFVNGFDKNPLLDFNVDGNILDKMGEA